MQENEEFYVGYVDAVGKKTKKQLRRFVMLALGLLLLAGSTFAFFQRPAANSSFDFGAPTEVTGVFHESPYPMLRVRLAENEYKEIVLLGFGKFGANPYLKEVRVSHGDLHGKTLQIEGELIYYNGKTLLQIDDSQKVTVLGDAEYDEATLALGQRSIQGEIIDPKCYFGVMKPGYGKIHRSCAALCIAGGMPPVLVSAAESGEEAYFLLTDLKGKPIHKDILPYIGQPALINGEVEQIGDWKLMKISVDRIQKLDKTSTIF